MLLLLSLCLLMLPLVLAAGLHVLVVASVGAGCCFGCLLSRSLYLSSFALLALV